MANVKMGFEGQFFYGASGSTGSTQLTNVTDIEYDCELEYGNSTVRGSGASVPIETQEPTLVKVSSIEWTMINDITDTNLASLLTSARAGTLVAIRTKDYSAGKGFDGDCSLSVANGQPIKGEQTYKFKAMPSRGAGRAPVLHV
jgi:hypothetical protein